jgi:hypothetical protein
LKKHWIGLAALVLLILVLFFIFFPQILSSTYGKRILIRSIETKTHSHVTVKSLHLSWFGPQRLTQLTMKDAEYEGTIESLQVGVPLTSLSTLFKLEHFEAINGDLKLENGLFQFHKEGSSSCTINDLQGTVLLHKGIADVTVSATSLQEGQKGSLSFRAQLKNLKTLFTDTSLHAELVSFPTLPLAYTLKRQELADDHLVLQTLGPLVGTVVGLTLEKGDVRLRASCIKCRS